MAAGRSGARRVFLECTTPASRTGLTHERAGGSLDYASGASPAMTLLTDVLDVHARGRIKRKDMHRRTRREDDRTTESVGQLMMAIVLPDPQERLAGAIRSQGHDSDRIA